MTYKVALWGFGNMNQMILSMLLEAGHTIVGVIGHHNLGEDAGELIGIEKLQLPITHPENAKELLTSARPDIVVLSTRTRLHDLAGALKVCASCKANVITIGEEPFYSWRTAPELTAELDTLFKREGVTYSASGYQDVYWLYLPAMLAGISHKLERIIGNSQFNMDDYGQTSAISDGVGLTEQEFVAKFPPESAVPTYVWWSNEALATRLGCKIIETNLVYEPIILEKDIESIALGATIPAGRVTGQRVVVTTRAIQKSGKPLEIVMNQTVQVYYDDLEDYCDWRTVGTPALEVSCKKVDTASITCTTVVNRLEQIINANPGYVPVCELGPMA